jgi:hypothetical protein
MLRVTVAVKDNPRGADAYARSHRVVLWDAVVAFCIAVHVHSRVCVLGARMGVLLAHCEDVTDLASTDFRAMLICHGVLK